MSKQGAERKTESVIDANLRRVYDEALKEGVPDRFRDLLAALKEQDKLQGNK